MKIQSIIKANQQAMKILYNNSGILLGGKSVDEMFCSHHTHK